MTFFEIIGTVLIKPLQLLFEFMYMFANRMIDDPGLSIIVLSLAMNFLVLPLYRRADAIQEEERDIENKLHDGVEHIKKTFKGDERTMILQAYYRQNHYSPTSVFKGSISLFLEIPFFIAAYQFLSHLEIIQGVSFGVIADLGAPDALLTIGTLSINVLPFVMTGINLISCVIFTKGYPTKTKVQLYTMAIFFLVFLYDSPAGLVFYWTLNNLFSLVKTVFYKLKNPGKVLRMMFAAIGVVFVLFDLAFYKTDVLTYRVVVGILGLICLTPFVIKVISRKKSGHFGWTIDGSKRLEGNKKLFTACTVLMTILTGLVIPSSVLKASPQEFVDVNYFVHPIWYIVSSFCLSVGTFLVWFRIFYGLVDKEKKVWFDKGLVIVAAASLVNYMLFAVKFGVLSSRLQYEEAMVFDGKLLLINALVMGLVVIAVLVSFRFIGKKLSQVIVMASLAFVIVSGINVYTVAHSVSQIKNQVSAGGDAEETNGEEKLFSLSKNGKNVIVFMLDRAMGEYIPYLVNEKPALKEMLSGFTYYANTVSFGAYTNFGSPALYGGYEYTPYEMNKRDTESLKSKQNEALKVMPVIFDEAGYKTTVCDPTYANYQWIPDLSIYDEYPSIKTYNTMGRFDDVSTKALKVSAGKRNFYCYSLMKVMPLALQTIIYDEGNYNKSTSSANHEVQYYENPYKAKGIHHAFSQAYSVLEHLSRVVETEDEGNTFLMISNDATHEPMLLQEPEYKAVEKVDNTDYETNHKDRFTVDGKELIMADFYDYAHYQVNMATLLKLGEWFDYLKANDLYDNTRIILVSDHGRNTGQLPSMIMKEEQGLYDMTSYYPLLMVKDFGAEEFSTSEDFMTNADVPTLAFEGLIDDPVNPSTGKLINNDEKSAHDQYVLGSDEWNLYENDGNTYFPGIWFSVHDDMRNLANWTELQSEALMPLS